MESLTSLVVAFCCFVAIVGHLFVGALNGDGFDGTTKMTFKPPNISAEEAHSNFMPEQLKCDACRIVAYQVFRFSSTPAQNYPPLAYSRLWTQKLAIFLYALTLLFFASKTLTFHNVL